MTEAVEFNASLAAAGMQQSDGVRRSDGAGVAADGGGGTAAAVVEDDADIDEDAVKAMQTMVPGERSAGAVQARATRFREAAL